MKVVGRIVLVMVSVVLFLPLGLIAIMLAPFVELIKGEKDASKNHPKKVKN